MTKCIGCGIKLQNTNKNKLGYVEDLSKNICTRCFRLTNYGEYQKVSLNNNDYNKIINNIEENSLVVYTTDILSLNLTDINKFKKVVVESKDPEYCYRYAKDVPGIDRKDLEQTVVESENLPYNYLYAKEIEDADLKCHYQVFLENGNVADLNQFETYIGLPMDYGLSPKRVKTLIKEINSEIKR